MFEIYTFKQHTFDKFYFEKLTFEKIHFCKIQQFWAVTLCGWLSLAALCANWLQGCEAPSAAFEIYAIPPAGVKTTRKKLKN